MGLQNQQQSNLMDILLTVGMTNIDLLLLGPYTHREKIQFPTCSKNHKILFNSFYGLGKRIISVWSKF